MSTPHIAPPTSAQIAGLVLAGGRGSRMAGFDKGLQYLAGRPLAAHVLARLRPQVGAILISANRNPDRYAEFNAPVLEDLRAGFAGPLAGLEAGLAHLTATPAGPQWLLTCPCDSPEPPLDLASRLMAATRGTALAVARVGGRLQPVFLLAHTCLLPGLRAYLDSGGHRVGQWVRAEPHGVADFDHCPAAFANINTREELQAYRPAS